MCRDVIASETALESKRKGDDGGGFGGGRLIECIECGVCILYKSAVNAVEAITFGTNLCVCGCRSCDGILI